MSRLRLRGRHRHCICRRHRPVANAARHRHRRSSQARSRRSMRLSVFRLNAGAAFAVSAAAKTRLLASAVTAIMVVPHRKSPSMSDWRLPVGPARLSAEATAAVPDLRRICRTCRARLRARKQSARLEAFPTPFQAHKGDKGGRQPVVPCCSASARAAREREVGRCPKGRPLMTRSNSPTAPLRSPSTTS